MSMLHYFSFFQILFFADDKWNLYPYNISEIFTLSATIAKGKKGNIALTWCRLISVIRENLSDCENERR